MREEFVHFPGGGKDQPFIVELAGTSYCDGSYRIHRHKSGCLVAEYVILGEGTVLLDGEKYHARAGDIYLLPPGREHLYFSDGDNPWTKIWFNASGPLVNSLSEVYDPKTLTVFPDAGGKEYFSRLHNIGRDEHIGAKQRHEQAAVVFLELMQYLHGRFYTGEKAYSPETCILKEYIDSHVTETLSLKKLGELVFLSESQVIRIFKRDLGITPYEYLLTLKMEQARRMLRSTELRVKEIAFLLGFSDEHYFTYLFKQRVGQAPTAYRKESRGNYHADYEGERIV